LSQYIIPIYSKSSRPILSAAALQKAIEHERIALAPSFDLFSVPSMDIKKSSNCFWLSNSLSSTASLIIVFTLLTAVSTPLPLNLFGSLSLNSKASLLPVDDPDGASPLALSPLSSYISTETVGNPLESSISIAFISLIFILVMYNLLI